MYVQRIYRERDDQYPDFVLFEHGKYERPVAIISAHDAKRIAVAYAEAFPEDAAVLLRFAERQKAKAETED